MHAYMIIAHNQFELLEKLICCLDDRRNDIFIHIDAKVKNFDFEKFSSLAKFSRVCFTDERINITWGGFSQVKCEMLLLKTAVSHNDENNPYTYYHLISGVDLPIKTNDEIYNFFEQNSGKEFIHYDTLDTTKSAVDRVKYYHFFRKKRNTFNKILAHIVLKAEKLLRVNRLKNTDIKVFKGSNWFSITGELARYVVENQKEYENMFKYSFCCDEIFIQTVVQNSDFKNNLFIPDSRNDYFSCARLIDWQRGNPYVFRKEDFDLIKSSPCMFARKFDLNTDSEIVDMIIESIS